MVLEEEVEEVEEEEEKVEEIVRGKVEEPVSVRLWQAGTFEPSEIKQ